MRWSIVFVVAGAAVGSGAGLPRIVGNPMLSADLAANKRWQAASDIINHLNMNIIRADDNENTKGRCGADHDNASCAPGYCCSSAG